MSSCAAAPMYDVEQVEVSRGPQGTLFGRNTPAGVVKFVTRKPSDEFEAFGQFAYGTHESLTAQAAVGGPISDMISVRVSGLYQRRGDWVDNVITGVEDALGGFQDLAGRIQVLVEPSDALSMLFNFHGRDYEGTSALFRANTIRQGGGIDRNNFIRDSVFFDGGNNNPQDASGWGGSAKIDYDFGQVTLTSITAYEKARGSSLGDIDGGFVGPNSFFNPASPPTAAILARYDSIPCGNP